MDDHFVAVVQLEAKPSPTPVDAFHLGALEQLLEFLPPPVPPNDLHGVAARSDLCRLYPASHHLFFQVALEHLDLRKLGHPVPFRPATPRQPRGVPTPPAPRFAQLPSCCVPRPRRTVQIQRKRAR